MALAQALAAPIVHASRGKETMEWDNPCDVGMAGLIGLIGFLSGCHAMRECHTLLVRGTDFPYRNFYPEDAAVVQIDRDPGVPGRRAQLRMRMRLLADVREAATLLAPLIEPGRDTDFLDPLRRR